MILRGRPKKFSAKDFTEAWLDRSLCADDVARRFGMSRATANRAAAAMALPSKPRGRRPTYSEAALAAMWRAGLATHEIASALRIDDMTVANAVRRLGLPLRWRGWRPKTSLAAMLSTAMARTAAIEQAAIINAEMADGCRSGGRLVGQRRARDAA